jgi:chymotrypsin
MNRMCRIFLVWLLAASLSASAIVIRHDTDDAKYRVQGSEFLALVDMPGEGHGVLIAPHWVVTAAHAVTWQSQIKHVNIAGVSRDVERLVIHPGYLKPPQALLDNALATWDWTLFRALLASSDDIALLKLAKPVTDVKPVAISKGNEEFGSIATIIGKGATGNGVAGYKFSDPHRTALRRAQNKITSAHGRWICYVFDEPSAALPLEGGSGSGDSGGPVLIQTASDWELAGLTSWSDPQSTVRTPGRYGQVTCNVRLSHYRDWIERVVFERP